jgi:hypothetical protein
MAYTAPAVPFVFLQSKRIGKGRVKNSESVANGGVNFFLVSSFIFTIRKAVIYMYDPSLWKEYLTDTSQGAMVAAFPIVNEN